MLSIDPTGSLRIAPPDGREVAMASFSLTSEMHADGIYLFDSGGEGGADQAGGIKCLAIHIVRYFISYGTGGFNLQNLKNCI
jgi:hypothetical protein